MGAKEACAALDGQTPCLEAAMGSRASCLVNRQAVCLEDRLTA